MGKLSLRMAYSSHGIHINGLTISEDKSAVVVLANRRDFLPWRIKLGPYTF